jgi:microcystin-dependent protein
MKEKRALVAAIALAWLPIIIGVAYPAVWQWSESASSNASADPQINWREGQPPSSVNDSARAMMAALASYRDDISGLLTTTGTASAYSVSTNQNLCASPATVPQDGQQLALTINITNGVAATLTADACSTYPIQSAPGVAVGSSTLIQGSPYTFRFSVANSAWMLRDFYGNSFNIPLGSGIDFWGSAVPNSNFAFANGQAISRTTYAALFAIMGTQYGAGDGTTTFNLPDKRGRVSAGFDTVNATGRLNTVVNAALLGSAGGEQTHTLAASEIPAISSAVNVTVGGSISGTTASNQAPVNAGTAFTALTPAAGTSSPVAVTGTFNGSGTGSASSNNTGGAAHNNVQPTIVCNYIIRIQ